MKTIDETTQKELSEGLAMSSIIDNTIGWLERRCSELNEVREEKRFADLQDGPLRKDDLARAVRYARECAKEYGFGHHADDSEIFAECEDEYGRTSREIDDLRVVGCEGVCENMRRALYECRRYFGKPLGDHWARMYNNDDLCGCNSVEELIGYC